MKRDILKILVVLMTLIGMVSFSAVNSNKNVEMKKVSFNNRAIKLAGNLYLPKNFKENNKYAAIVLSHPGGGVKEQTVSIYARKLAEKGFVALTFDASYQGESGGKPRFLEDPFARTEDIRSAIDYLDTLSFVDENKIGAFGICAGGGYSLTAATTDKRIKAVATVSMFNMGRAPFGSGNPFLPEGEKQNAAKSKISEASIKELEETAKQRQAEVRGEKIKYNSFIDYDPSKLDRSIPMQNFLYEMYEYYATPRGKHPNSPMKIMARSMDLLYSYSAFDHLDTLLNQPALIIAGSRAETLEISKTAYNLINGKNKELFLVEGATHFDMYDKPQYVNQAVEKLDKFYKNFLK